MLEFAQSKRSEDSLKQVDEACGKLPEPKAELKICAQFNVAPQVLIANQAVWSSARSKMLEIEANAAETFKTKRFVTIKQCTDAIGRGFGAVKESVFGHYRSTLSTQLAALSDRGVASLKF